MPSRPPSRQVSESDDRRATRPVCEGFAWVGQSLLCCDDCGNPWFLHPGDKTFAGPFTFGSKPQVKPYDEERKAQIAELLAAWEANNIWQAERGPQIWDVATQQYRVQPDVERQVGKDFPYPTGPTRPVAGGRA